MILIRVNGESCKDDLVFTIDYKDIYDKLCNDERQKDKKCLLDILGVLSKGKNLFFQYTEFNDALNEDTEFFKDSYFMDCHNTGYRYITDEVKDILLKHYEYNNVIASTDADGIKEELLTKLKNTSVDDIDKSLLEDIKQFIYKKHFKSKISDYPNEIQDFVNKRIFISIYDYGFPYIESFRCQDRPLDFIRDLWIKIVNKEDVNYWIESMGSDFWCITNDKNSIEDYEYCIKYDCDWINGTELELLDVLERNKGDFIKNVFPLLEKEFGFEIKLVTNIDEIL